MSMWKTLILLSGIGLILAAAFLLRGLPDHTGRTERPLADRVAGVGPEEMPEGNHTASPRDTKSRLRSQDAALTQEETIKLLHSTIIDHFVVDDASVEDCIGLINETIRKAGIPEDRLHAQLDARDKGILGQLRIRELQLRHASLADVFKHLCGNTKLRYRVNAGTVSIGSATSALETEPANKHDPIAEPGKQTDPFGEEDDPFGPSE